MPEGKVIEFQEGEYPELDGLEVGASVKLRGSATIEDMGNGAKALRIDSMEFETESPATREFKSMTKQESAGVAGTSEGAGDDF